MTFICNYYEMLYYILAYLFLYLLFAIVIGVGMSVIQILKDLLASHPPTMQSMLSLVSPTCSPTIYSLMPLASVSGC